MDLRRVARACLEAAIEAVNPWRLVARALADGSIGAVSPAGRLLVVAVGKAAVGMASGALEALGPTIDRVVVVVPTGSPVEPALRDEDRVEIIRAGHPLPDSGSLRSGRRIAEVAADAGRDDALLVLLSGGASALMTWPVDGVALGDLQQTTGDLLAAGASIDELNTVRKHLDRLKGGGLARLASPAAVSALVISDVVGDRLEVIGSGPLTDDPTTAADAVSVLHQRGVWASAPESIRECLLKQARRQRIGATAEVTSRLPEVSIIGSNDLAVGAVLREAERQGFAGRVSGKPLVGEARDAGRALVRWAVEAFADERPLCCVAGGETTVTVRGDGRGGRNQELALAAAIELAGRRGILLAAVGTDGVDGPTDAAGAWVDGSTVERGRDLGLSAAEALERNDAYAYFDSLGDLIITGPTGTNVMDLAIVLAD